MITIMRIITIKTGIACKIGIAGTITTTNAHSGIIMFAFGDCFAFFRLLSECHEEGLEQCTASVSVLAFLPCSAMFF